MGRQVLWSDNRFCLMVRTSGSIEAYAQVCEQSRSQAYSRMVVQAKELGADAVIAVRYDATEFSPNVTEVLAYGTAVKLND